MIRFSTTTFLWTCLLLCCQRNQSFMIGSSVNLKTPGSVTFFTPTSTISQLTATTSTNLQSHNNNNNDKTTENDNNNNNNNKNNDLLLSLPITAAMIISTSVAIITANIPWSVYAAIVEDDYEYGKVDAPIGIAVAGGILAILTAAVPVLLRPGEEALEEMRENEGFTFGSSNSKDTLNKRK